VLLTAGERRESGLQQASFANDKVAINKKLAPMHDRP